MLDFSKKKQRYFEITLHDGTELSLPPWTLAQQQEVAEMFQGFDETAEGFSIQNALDLVYELLSNNKQRLEITDEQVRAFDDGDIVTFFTDFTAFINETRADPNFKSPTARGTKKKPKHTKYRPSGRK